MPTREPITLNRRELARFFAKVRVNADTGCWEWTAGQNGHGYGTFYLPRLMHRTAKAHVVAFCAFGGAGEGDDIDHLCRNRACVNPAHLEAVSHLENMARSTSSGASTLRTGICRFGHPFTGDNIMVRNNGKRECRECHRARFRKWHAKHGAARNARRRAATRSA